MANIYVRSGAGGAGTGADWANAYTSLKTAAEAGGTSAGDDIWVSEDHAETQAANHSITFKGTPSSPNRVICVNHSGTVPPVAADLATTATLATTTSATLTLSGVAYIYGITFTCGSGANAPDFIICDSTNSDLTFEACAVRCGGTSGGRLLLGTTSNSVGAKVVWNNTTYQVAAAGSTIQTRARIDFLWKNTATAITGATIPTNLIGTAAQSGGQVVLDGVDLIALSTKTIVQAQSSTGYVYIKDCKLPASITICGAPTGTAPRISVIRSASGATAYNLEAHDIRGDQTTETTIVRTGGTTINGTGVAMKIVGTSSATYTSPFVSTPLVVTNTTTGSNVTVTVYGIWAGGAVPTNKQVWMEVGYLGSASTPQLTFNSGTIATPLTAASNQSTDSSVWGGSTTAFKLVTTLSSPQPALAGEMYIVIKVASTNATYIDPTPVLS